MLWHNSSGQLIQNGSSQLIDCSSCPCTSPTCFRGKYKVHLNGDSFNPGGGWGYPTATTGVIAAQDVTVTMVYNGPTVSGFSGVGWEGTLSTPVDFYNGGTHLGTSAAIITMYCSLTAPYNFLLAVNYQTNPLYFDGYWCLQNSTTPLGNYLLSCSGGSTLAVVTDLGSNNLGISSPSGVNSVCFCYLNLSGCAQTGSITWVADDPSVGWSWTTTDGNMTLTSSTTGTGSGNLTFSIIQNPGAAYIGYIIDSVSGQIVPVNVAAYNQCDCYGTLTATVTNLCDTNGVFSLFYQGSGSCSWCTNPCDWTSWNIYNDGTNWNLLGPCTDSGCGTYNTYLMSGDSTTDPRGIYTFGSCTVVIS